MSTELAKLHIADIATCYTLQSIRQNNNRTSILEFLLSEVKAELVNLLWQRIK